jgi:hypothetical protein
MSQPEVFIPLPDNLITPTDLAKVIKEIDSIDSFMVEAKDRAPGKPVTLPKTSKPLEDVAKLNNISLLDKEDRRKLKQELTGLLDNPLKVRISFASNPSGTFKHQVVSWLRREVHPAVFVEVGLQPSMIAGCVLKTKNKVFDMSLRGRLNLNTSSLSETLNNQAENAS